jgi:Domain of unknown function (DUF4190)/GYF domain 2
MYKIIGGDGREYGPVDAEQLRRWIIEGRADWQTLTQAVGIAGWKPLGSFSEFRPAVPPIIAASPPPWSGSPATTGTNGMAVAGFAFGLLGLFCCGPLFSIPGIVLSCVALSQIKSDPMRHTDRGLAMAGLVLSIIGLVAGLASIPLLGALRILGRHPMYWYRMWQF